MSTLLRYLCLVVILSGLGNLALAKPFTLPKVKPGDLISADLFNNILSAIEASIQPTSLEFMEGAWNCQKDVLNVPATYSDGYQPSPSGLVLSKSINLSIAESNNEYQWSSTSGHPFAMPHELTVGSPSPPTGPSGGDGGGDGGDNGAGNDAAGGAGDGSGSSSPEIKGGDACDGSGPLEQHNHATIVGFTNCDTVPKDHVTALRVRRYSDDQMALFRLFATEGSNRDWFQIICDRTTTVPDAPTDLKAFKLVGDVSVPPVQIGLFWSAVDGAVDGYHVYRRAGVSWMYGKVADVAQVANPQYQDADVQPDTLYYYKVTAYNNGGESSAAYSQSVCTAAGDAGCKNPWETVPLKPAKDCTGQSMIDCLCGDKPPAECFGDYGL